MCIITLCFCSLFLILSLQIHYLLDLPLLDFSAKYRMFPKNRTIDNRNSPTRTMLLLFMLFPIASRVCRERSLPQATCLKIYYLHQIFVTKFYSWNEEKLFSATYIIFSAKRRFYCFSPCVFPPSGLTISRVFFIAAISYIAFLLSFLICITISKYKPDVYQII